MANAREEDFVSALRAEIVGVLVRESGAPETHAIDMASKILAAVTQRYRGTEPYIGAAAPRYDRNAVLLDLQRYPTTVVCERHGISRATLWRLRQRRT